METSKKSKRAPKPVRVKALVIGDLGVGKYALISQIAWGVEPYISNQVNCTMDNPVIDVQIDISEPPRATTETSSTVQSVLNPEIQHVDSQSRLGCTEVKINDKNEKGEAQEDPSTADSAPRRADIEMAVWRILPSLAEEPWRLNEIYFQHSSVVALCYHVTETETLNNAVNKVSKLYSLQSSSAVYGCPVRADYICAFSLNDLSTESFIVVSPHSSLPPYHTDCSCWMPKGSPTIS
jgi:hypothetical protein